MSCTLRRAQFSSVFLRAGVLLQRRLTEFAGTARGLGMARVVDIKSADQVTLDRTLDEAALVLRSGGVVALPTETVYGIASSAESSEGIEKLYRVKGRRKTKPIAICLNEVDDIDRWAQRTVTFDLLRDLLPGPVTTVFERSSQLNAQLNPGTALVGIRVPDHPIARQLAARCGHPLALTSANVSDAGNTVAVEEFQDLWPQLDLVLDGGRIEGGPKEAEVEGESRMASTVVDLSQQGKFKIIRRGSSCDHIVQLLTQKYSLTEITT